MYPIFQPKYTLKNIKEINELTDEKIAKMLKILHKGKLTTKDYCPFERLKNIESERNKLYKAIVK